MKDLIYDLRIYLIKRKDDIFIKVNRLIHENLYKGRVPTYVFDIFKGENTLVGTCCLRIGYNSEVYYSSNVEIEIFERYKNNNYEYKVFSLLIEVAKEHLMDYFLLACNISDLYSQEIFEKAGCRYLGIEKIPVYLNAYSEKNPEKCIYKLRFSWLEG